MSKKDMTDSEHLQWLHDRIVNVYGESENVDFLIKFREIIKDIKDVDLVEQLGSGIPRILETYGKECFQFSANFLRMVFPSAEPVHKEEPNASTKDGLVKELVINLVKGLVKELSDTQIKILNLVSEDKYITKSAMAKNSHPQHHFTLKNYTPFIVHLTTFF